MQFAGYWVSRVPNSWEDPRWKMLFFPVLRAGNLWVLPMWRSLWIIQTISWQWNMILWRYQGVCTVQEKVNTRSMAITADWRMCRNCSLIQVSVRKAIRLSGRVRLTRSSAVNRKNEENYLMRQPGLSSTNVEKPWRRRIWRKNSRISAECGIFCTSLRNR